MLQCFKSYPSLFSLCSLTLPPPAYRSIVHAAPLTRAWTRSSSLAASQARAGALKAARAHLQVTKADHLLHVPLFASITTAGAQSLNSSSSLHYFHLTTRSATSPRPDWTHQSHPSTVGLAARHHFPHRRSPHHREPPLHGRSTTEPLHSILCSFSIIVIMLILMLSFFSLAHEQSCRNNVVFLGSCRWSCCPQRPPSTTAF
jgi:hypothetical protein